MPERTRDEVVGSDLARTQAIVRLWDRLAAAGSDPRQVAEVAVEAVQRAFGGGVAVFLVDVVNPDQYRMTAVRHEVPEVSDALHALVGFTTGTVLPEGLFATASRTGQPVVMADPWGTDGAALPDWAPGYLPWLADHPLTSVLVVPLALDGRRLGLLVAGRHEPGASYDAAQVAFAEQVARRISLAMSNAQLTAVEHEVARLERAVAEVSRRCEEALGRTDDVADVAVAAVGQELRAGCALWLVDEAGAELLGRVAVHEPDPDLETTMRDLLAGLALVDEDELLGAALREGRALVDDQALARTASRYERLAPHLEELGRYHAYAVRLEARGATLGLLAVRRLTPFGVDELRLVDALAARLALTLDNAALLALARTSQQRQRALVQHSSDMLILTDGDGAVRYASPSASRLFGADLAESFLARVVDEERERARSAWRRVLRRPGLHPAAELTLRNAAGSRRRLSVVANNLLDQPDVQGVVLTVRDVTAEREAAERLAERAAQQAALASVGAAALARPPGELHEFVARCVGDTMSLSNVGVLQLTPARTWRILGSNAPQFGPGFEMPTLPGSGLERVLSTGQPVVVDDYRKADVVDEPYVVEQYGTISGAIIPISVSGRIWGCLGAYSQQQRRFAPVEVDFLQTMAALVASALEREAIAEQMLHQAQHDALTALPNRTQLRDHLDRMLATVHGGASAVALLLLDLDDFKDVNDALGHQVGDQALSQLGARLCALAEDGDLVARLGGDEFAICLAPRRNEMRALEVAEGVLAALREPFTLPGIDVTMSGSIGISVGPAHGREPDALLQAADMAMYRAKAERSGWALYDPRVDGQRAERLAVLAHLRTGLARGDLDLYYQPLVDLRSNEVVEVEALVRWRHPTRGLLLPGAFVPLAEQTELVHDLTRYTVMRAVEQATAWRAQGWPGCVAVNISPAALRRPGLVRELQEALASAAGAVTVEITESALVDERARNAVHVLARAGVRCSVDDFGTGYSSLTYLRTLPVTRLKLDRAFNRRVDRDDRDAAIVGGVVDLAHSIGLDVVAEGVETLAVSERLHDLEVDVAQGWLYGRPEPAGVLTLVG